jgi:hypothetical protein
VSSGRREAGHVTAVTWLLIVTLLFADFGSTTADVTVAEFVNVLVTMGAIALTWMFCCPPFGVMATVHVTVALPVASVFVAQLDWEEGLTTTALPGLVPAGSGSVSVTPVASLGPLSLIWKLYEMSPPGWTLLEEEPVSWRSAPTTPTVPPPPAPPAANADGTAVTSASPNRAVIETVGNFMACPFGCLAPRPEPRPPQDLAGAANRTLQTSFQQRDFRRKTRQWSD